MTQYSKKIINVTINLGKGQFGDNTGDTVTLSGYRVSASMTSYVSDAQGQLQLRIFGLPISMIDQLTTIGPVMTDRKNNRITVTAGEQNGSMTTIYSGTISSAFGDFQGAPEVVLNIIALAAAYESVKAIPAQIHAGTANVVDIMSDLAKTMNFVFENNGVTGTLQDRTFSGSAMTQVKECAQAAKINYTVDRGKLAIWPRIGYRAGNPVNISAATGMVGYPSFSSKGIVLTTLFNQDVNLGGRVNVTSELKVACGIWNIFHVSHMLESETPNGQWFTQIECNRGTNA